MGSASDLVDAVARIESRFGVHAISWGPSFERRSDEATLRLGSSFDRLTGGVPLGAACVFAGVGTSGKLTLALAAAAAAQREGAHVMWVDPTSSLDPLGAERAGVDLGRLLVVRARTREDALFAAAAGLRSGGFRLVALDTGSELCSPAVRADDVAPLIPIARGSPAALLVISDRSPRHLALQTFKFTALAWERELGRTTGWTFSVRGGRGEEALFHARSLGRTVLDLGVRTRVSADAPRVRRGPLLAVASA